MRRLNLPKEKAFVGPAQAWKRIAAFLIDLVIILGTVMLPFRSLLLGIFPKGYSSEEILSSMKSSASYTNYFASITLIMSLLTFFYFLILEKNMGQTIGKKLMNIYVVSDINGIRTWQVLVRNLIFVPIFPFYLLLFIDPIFMFFTKTNQRLSEILSKTKVVEKYLMQT